MTATLGRGPVVVIGHDGMLGTAWKAELDRAGIAHADFSVPAFDLTQREHIDALPVADGTVVINCAGWTNVDGAETDEAGATRLNGEGVGLLADRCARVGATVVHYSTDYVFDGEATSPYPVDELQRPLSAYGRSKALGERKLWASGATSLLVRTSWLYAPWGNNFVRTIAKLARERATLSVVDDQRGRPTSAEHLASATRRLLDAGTRGIVHVTDGDECTWFGFATAIARAVAPTCDVRPCTTADFPRPARRPPYSVLDLSRTEAVLGPMPPWQTSLADVLARIG
jgi:dTDP-4-dehydrorhamnose reductase